MNRGKDSDPFDLLGTYLHMLHDFYTVVKSQNNVIVVF